MMRKRNALFLSLFLVLSAISGCIQIEEESSAQIFEKITAEEAKRLIEERKEDPNFIVIDIRTPEEYAQGHLPGAVNLNFYSESFREDLNRLERDKVYLIYCRSGHRSGVAVPLMKELGFKEVYELEGGILEWISKGYSLER